MTPDSMPANPAEAYQDYFVPAIFMPWARVLLEEYAKPKPGEHVLDVACGTGAVTRMIAPMVGPTGRVVGLDVNVAMLAVARGQSAPAGAAIDWREESALAMTLPNASFDLVLCQQGLQFFPDRQAGVREMRRVLKPGGRAIVACWQSLDRQGAISALIQAESRHFEMPIEPLALPFSLGDAAQLRALFTNAGFDDVSVSERAMVVRLPQPDRFVQLSIQSATAAIPGLREMDALARAQLEDAITRELHDQFRARVDGDFLATPMIANIVTAR